MRAVTEKQLADASKFAAYLTACTGAVFFAGIIAAFVA